MYTISRTFVYAFFGVAWNLKNMHFPRENAYVSGSRAGKKMYISIFPKKWKNSTDMHFFEENACFCSPNLDPENALY